MGNEIGCNNLQEHGECSVIQKYLYDNGKEFRVETLYFFYVELCSATEMEAKCSRKHFKCFSRVFISVLETSMTS